MRVEGGKGKGSELTCNFVVFSTLLTKHCGRAWGL